MLRILIAAACMAMSFAAAAADASKTAPCAVRRAVVAIEKAPENARYRHETPSDGHALVEVREYGQPSPRFPVRNAAGPVEANSIEAAYTFVFLAAFQQALDRLAAAEGW